MKMTKWIGAIVLCLNFSAAVFADSAPVAIAIQGAVSKPGDWTMEKIRADLKEEFTTLDYTGHDGKHTSTVVPLIAVLKDAGVETVLITTKSAPKEKHAELHYVVVVQGRDGYYTVLSIGELLSDIGNRKAYLAMDVDGKPWPEADAPMKLILPDDKKSARWVHSVQMISVVKIEAPATQAVK